MGRVRISGSGSRRIPARSRIQLRETGGDNEPNAGNGDAATRSSGQDEIGSEICPDDEVVHGFAGDPVADPGTPKVYKVYPSAPPEARVARCYACDEVSSKHRLIVVGYSRTSPGEIIYRHEECAPGSIKWLTIFKAHEDPEKLKMWWAGAAAEKLNPDQRYALGKIVVEERKKQIEAEIVKRLDNKKKGKDAESKVKKAGTSVIIQRPRKRDGNRSVQVQRYRHGAC